MDLAIHTEHILMQPEWHRTIDEWVQHCTRHHPEVVRIDLRLRHHGVHPREEVSVVATAGHRNLQAARHAHLMGVALDDALGALECELVVHEAGDPGNGRERR